MGCTIGEMTVYKPRRAACLGGVGWNVRVSIAEEHVTNMRSDYMFNEDTVSARSRMLLSGPALGEMMNGLVEAPHRRS